MITRRILRTLARAGLVKPLKSTPALDDARSPARRDSDTSHALTRSFTNAAGTRPYTVFTPSNVDGSPKPLLVMLHGCTQGPEDFAAGTRMNQLAERHGFVVVYPGQTQTANGMKCWNWFNTTNQLRGRGEPSIIAGIVAEVVGEFQIDEAQIFVAGLSAGAAMAVIMGATYPDVFSAVGAHSGIPYRAAHSVASALSVMRSATTLPFDLPWGTEASAKLSHAATRFVPTIVFHGDQDARVNVGNGAGIVERAAELAQAAFGRLQMTDTRELVNGREVALTVYSSPDGQAVIEYWLVHAAGHAWSGGSANGSHTDESGPDASAEMVRFFLASVPQAKSRSLAEPRVAPAH